jgi:hypothetical protein
MSVVAVSALLLMLVILPGCAGPTAADATPVAFVALTIHTR